MVSESEIPREYISVMVKKGEIVRVKRGVYRLPDAYDDEMFALQSNNPLLIFSHDTALFLHELTDRDPIQYTVTVPKGIAKSIVTGKGFCGWSF